MNKARALREWAANAVRAVPDMDGTASDRPEPHRQAEALVGLASCLIEQGYSQGLLRVLVGAAGDEDPAEAAVRAISREERWPAPLRSGDAAA